MKSSKRDWIIIITIMIAAFLGFFIFNQIFSNTNSQSAEVIYTPQGTLVKVDFENEKIIVVEVQQNVPIDLNRKYPIIDEQQQTITLLGDYEIKGLRQEVVIYYSFKDRSMKIIKEESPNHVCSNLGTSTGKPLICLPNSIRVKFIDTSVDIDDEL